MAAGAGQGSLLIGDFNSATNPDILRKYNIRTVITAAVGMEHLKIPTNCHAPLSSSSASSHGNGNSKSCFIQAQFYISPIRYLILLPRTSPSSSTTLMLWYRLVPLFLFLDLHKGSVLVHCAAGISRVIYFLFLECYPSYCLHHEN